MVRAPCCDEAEVKRGPWTEKEDEKLKEFIEKHGPGNWRYLPKKAGLKLCGKSCHQLSVTRYQARKINSLVEKFEKESAKSSLAIGQVPQFYNSNHLNNQLSHVKN